MSPREELTDREGLELLHDTITHGGSDLGHLEIRHSLPDGTRRLTAVCSNDLPSLRWHVDEYAPRGDFRLGLSLRDRRDVSTPIASYCLWVDLMGKKAHKLLADFPRWPTLVLRYGDTNHRVAIWRLEEPVDPRTLETANRRLAFLLEAPKVAAQPDFTVMPPGALLRIPRRVPEPVRVTVVRDLAYYADDVVEGLPVHPKGMAA